MIKDIVKVIGGSLLVFMFLRAYFNGTVVIGTWFEVLKPLDPFLILLAYSLLPALILVYLIDKIYSFLKKKK